MPTTLIISSAGFAVCFLLLFYFVAKYRQALSDSSLEEFDILDEVSSAASTAAKDAKRIFSSAATPDVRDIVYLQEKIKELHYKLEEIKLLQEKQLNDTKNTISALEQRLTSFENEYINNLQPTLQGLIKELELIHKE
jgi:phosphopantothenoylcysteine synthetase/decarboxylase